MCTPALVPAMVAASLAVSVAGTGVSVAGQIQQSKAAAAQGKYEAKVARYEAVLERQKGVVENVRFGINARREWGKFMNQNAATARDLSFGNAASQAVEMRQFHTFDSDIIARNAEARVLSLNMSVNNAITRGKNLAAGYRLGAAASGLSGLASAAQSGLTLYAGLNGGAFNRFRLGQYIMANDGVI